MRSKTSFFNFTVFWKDVCRFWPVWGGYLALWTLIGPLMILGNRYSYNREVLRAANNVLELGYIGGVIMGAIFGILAAMAVWNFAYRARSAHAIACLPVRREGMFTALSLAGLLPLLAANVVTALLILLAELQVGCVDFPSLGLFLVLTSLPLLFYYGLATFCAQLTGNILVLPALYALLNFLVPGLELLVRAVGGIFVFGIRQDPTAFTLLKLSPFIASFRYGGVNSQYITDESGHTELQRATVTGWELMGIYAAVGVVFLVLALLLYRRRRMESAGDVVAVNVLKPVFRWCMAIGCALCLGLLLFMIIYEDSYGTLWFDSQMLQLLSLVLLMFVGAFVGWFIAQMLIQKSFRVFRGHWVGYGVCCLVIAVAMFATEFDLLGFERRVPAPDKIDCVLVDYNAGRVLLEQPENLEAVTALHRSIVDNKARHETDKGEWTYVSLSYTLRNGRSMHRYYQLRYDPGQYGDAGTLQTLINCPEAINIRKQTSIPINIDTISGGYVTGLISAAEGAELDGYDSPEDWILTAVCGYDPSELELLDEAARENALEEAVYYRSYNSRNLWYLREDQPVGVVTAAVETADYMQIPRIPPQDPYGGYKALEDIDLSKVLFEHTWEFSFRELAELYESCIQPDLSEGTLGRVWILNDDDYYREATGVRINIDANLSRNLDERDESYELYGPGVAGGRSYCSFYTVPTVDSQRTNAWLEAHGVPVRSLAETLKLAAD